MPPSIIVKSPGLIQWVERTECVHLARQVEACQSLLPRESFAALTVAGGTVAVTAARFGSKLNNVVGIGTTQSASHADMQNIEERFSRIGLPTIVDLCPHADKTTLDVLTSRRYHPYAFLNVYTRSLEDIDANDPLETLIVEHQGVCGAILCRVQAHEEDAFVQSSVDGFGAYRSTETLETLARISTRRLDTLLYAVKVDDQVASTAATALIDTQYGRAAWLYLGSTIPKYRRRGFHHALGRTRLLDARKNGCDIAFVVAGRGTASARNAERLGFSVAYTKTLFCKDQEHGRY